MVQIHVEYEGDLRCRAVHGPSGAELATDAPTDNQGRGESFSPTDLVATALGTCMLTIMGMRARERGWDLAGATVDVKKVMQKEPVRRVARLEVEIRVPGGEDLDEAARELLERAALTCPVAETLGDRVEQPVHFVWAAAPVR